MIIYGSVGFSGLNYGYDNRGVVFSSIVPKEANKDVYVYFGRASGFSIMGLYFDFYLFEIGPALTASIKLEAAGRGIARLNKDIELEGDDVIHDCIEPGKQGCITGRSAGATSLKFRMKVDLLFWSNSWNMDGKDWLTGESGADFFYHSLEHGDERHMTGKQPYCPHELYRFTVHVTEFDQPVKGL